MSNNSELENLANLAKAIGHPHRLALLQNLFINEYPVETLSELTSLSVTNTSQHLQQLKKAGLVSSRRNGKSIIYSIGDGPIANILAALRNFQLFQHNEIKSVIYHGVHYPEQLDGVSIAELIEKMDNGAYLLDVRSKEDYLAGHIPGAVNIPCEELNLHLSELPKTKPIITYCGGRYCILSINAVAQLKEHGFDVSRVPDGFPGWQAAGLPID
ncbi:metalloregulator ArsR/SmtB family transcription factor [Acinetobacter sp.]|jgi:rhodanese-related sulfurtransferase/DNA-binding MarR family transcriptional regulator|uniref:ArsR/SmtB family transcription factor n=1 Tax=Acinetobacter sp. TaxID=472 RepID=UPI00282E03AE|nr:metalloregulator ArsR/SmtB family transcription factor [Acinetobacter sp.]MDR2248526.1 metalloregulator ArsR/SmtB family transcription factor [Acinetobacter sp.]